MENSLENSWSSMKHTAHNLEDGQSVAGSSLPTLPSFPPLCYPPQPSPVDGTTYLVTPSMASPSNCLALPSQQTYPYSSHPHHPYYSGMLASQQGYFPPPPPFYSSYYSTSPQLPTSSALTYNHQNTISNLASSCPASSPIIQPLHSPLHLPPVPITFPVQLPPKSDSLAKSNLNEENYLSSTANSYAYPSWNCAVEHETLRLAQYSSCQVEEAYRNSRDTNAWNPLLAADPDKIIDEPPKILPLAEVEAPLPDSQSRFKQNEISPSQGPGNSSQEEAQTQKAASSGNDHNDKEDCESNHSSCTSSKGSSHNLLSPGAESFLSSENESIDLGFEHLSETEGVDLLQDSHCFNDLQHGHVTSLSNLPNFDLMPASRNESEKFDALSPINDGTDPPDNNTAAVEESPPAKEVTEIYYENHQGSNINKENFVPGDIEESPMLVCYFCQLHIQAFQDINEIHRSVPAGTLTSATRTPVLGKLSTILDCALVYEEQGWVLCRRCFVLIDRVDLLELELLSVKREIYRTYDMVYKRNDHDLAPVPSPLAQQPTPESVPQPSDVVNSGNPVNAIREPIVSESEPSPCKPRVLTDHSQVNVVKKSLVKRSLKVIKTHLCDVCGKCFSTKISLRRHIQLHDGKFEFSCDQCPQGFTSKNSLENHQMKHTGDRKYFCPVCSKGFIQKVHFKAHMTSHDGNYDYKCEMCDKGFTAKTALQVHMRSHTNEKPYVCHACNRGFAVKSNLTTHIAICSGKCAWRCEECGKGFSLRSLYEKHLKAHKGKFDHCCNLCEAGFQKLSQLKAHLRTHTKEKPFLCHICGRGFASQSNCRAHEKTHSEERRFACDICGKGFARRYAMNLHVSRHTQDTNHKDQSE